MSTWLWRVCCATALLQAAFYAVRVLVSYRILELGGSAITIGAVTGLFSLAPLMIAMQIGRSVDRGHARTIFAAGVALTAVGCATLAASPMITVVSLGSVLVGCGQLLATVASQAFVSQLATPGISNLDRGFAALTLGVSIGQAAGVPLAGLITQQNADGSVETTIALAAMAVVSALALPFVLLLPRPATVPRGGRSVARQSVIEMLRLRGLKPAMFSSLVVLAAMDLTVAYLPLLGQEFGFSVTLVAVLITVRTVASIASRALLPLLLLRVPRRVLLISATLAPALPIAALPLTSNPWLMGLLLAVAGVFWGIGQPLTMTWVVELVTPENRGAALSLRLTGNRLGQVAVPFAAGALAGIGGPTIVFVVLGALLASASYSTTIATRRR